MLPCGFLNSRKRLRPESVFLAFTENNETNCGKIVEKQMSRDYQMNKTYEIFEACFEFSKDKKDFMRFRKKLGTVLSNSLFGIEIHIYNLSSLRFPVNHKKISAL